MQAVQPASGHVHNAGVEGNDVGAALVYDGHYQFKIILGPKVVTVHERDIRCSSQTKAGISRATDSLVRLIYQLAVHVWVSGDLGLDHFRSVVHGSVVDDQNFQLVHLGLMEDRSKAGWHELRHVEASHDHCELRRVQVSPFGD
jgi:hypothetical protein